MKKRHLFLGLLMAILVLCMGNANAQEFNINNNMTVYLSPYSSVAYMMPTYGSYPILTIKKHTDYVGGFSTYRWVNADGVMANGEHFYIKVLVPLEPGETVVINEVTGQPIQLREVRTWLSSDSGEIYGIQRDTFHEIGPDDPLTYMINLQ